MSSVLPSTTVHQNVSADSTKHELRHCLFSITLRRRLNDVQRASFTEGDPINYRHLLASCYLFEYFCFFFSITQSTFLSVFLFFFSLPFPPKRVCALIDLFEAYDSAVLTNEASSTRFLSPLCSYHP